MIVREARIEDARAIAVVHVNTWKTAYRGIVPDSHLDSLLYEKAERTWACAISDPGKRSILRVVEDESGSIVGFAAGGAERTGKYGFSGELYAIYVLPDCQRDGVGHLLVESLASELLRRDMTSMLVWAFKANVPARMFYKGLGGQYVDTKIVSIGGADLEEVAYGWSDIGYLIEGISTASPK
jgi:ribosomal protein S18 acetylase RimI-like enzyme